MPETWKRPITLGIDCQLLDQAEELGLDISEIAQRAVKRAIAVKSNGARGNSVETTLHGPLAKRVRYTPPGDA